MLRKSLLATALVVATLVGPAILPQSANAQVIVQTPGFGINVGVPYNSGYYNNSGYYGSNYYNGTGYTGYYYNNRGYNGAYSNGYRPVYNNYRPYNNYNQSYYGRGFVGTRYNRVYR